MKTKSNLIHIRLGSAPRTKKEKEAERQNIRLAEENYKEIVRVAGKRRADQANIGWSSSEDCISSKVYGDPCLIVTSYLTEYGTIEHEVEDY